MPDPSTLALLAVRRHLAIVFAAVQIHHRLCGTIDDVARLRRLTSVLHFLADEELRDHLPQWLTMAGELVRDAPVLGAC